MYCTAGARKQGMFSQNLPIFPPIACAHSAERYFICAVDNQCTYPDGQCLTCLSKSELHAVKLGMCLPDTSPPLPVPLDTMGNPHAEEFLLPQSRGPRGQQGTAAKAHTMGTHARRPWVANSIGIRTLTDTGAPWARPASMIQRQLSATAATITVRGDG